MSGESGATVSGEVTLSGPGWRFTARLTVAAGPTTRRQMLPLVQQLSNTSAEMACRSAEKRGEPISCRAGCAACCRQVVLVSMEEARLLTELVEAMPEPRRSAVKARFAEGVRRLEEAGLRAAVEHMAQLPDEERSPLGLAYFALGIACPFLEEERCSIYEQRPLSCREYLVTSPAEHCSQPSGETVKQLALPFKTTALFARLGESPPAKPSPRPPLLLALEAATAVSDEPPQRTGPEWVQLLLDGVAGKRATP
jgi:Fe-S-cluster containining protein